MVKLIEWPYRISDQISGLTYCIGSMIRSRALPPVYLKPLNIIMWSCIIIIKMWRYKGCSIESCQKKNLYLDMVWFGHIYNWLFQHLLLELITGTKLLGYCFLAQWWILPRPCLLGIAHQLPWPIFDLSYNLYYVIRMGFQTLIPEPNHLGLLIFTMVDSMKTFLVIANEL